MPPPDDPASLKPPFSRLSYSKSCRRAQDSGEYASYSIRGSCRDRTRPDPAINGLPEVSAEGLRESQRSEAERNLGETSFQRVIYHTSCMPEGRESRASSALMRSAMSPGKRSPASINTTCGVVVFPHRQQ
ncbi:hypothetical protein FOZ63_005028 [Perkinsus olseni]|uniref:Uncharacterized protein n=1 Tax=Perkinsus olseni TaxID=32597 RepID=A0A7J6REI9_PEROL|nr:hypothetical protein FOZ63_005028 [Perkinsus olseni]KAF4756359.1 hypothetical protein FOZ62_018671 [Perkinsus olseni]